MTEEPVLVVPQEREIRDELQRLVPADLHGPLGGDDEEFSGENPIDRYPLGRLAPRGVVLEPDDQDDAAHDETAERQRLAMAYRFHPEFAVGSGVAVHADIAADNPLRATRIHTRTVPDYEMSATDVPSADTDPDLAALADLELGMQRLAELAEASADSLAAGLRPLVVGYRAWIERRTADIDKPGEYLAYYADQARDNLDAAARAADRIEAGIDLLVRDDIARRAFGFANRAMYLQRLHTQVAAHWPIPAIPSDPRTASRRSPTCCGSPPAAARPRRTSG